MIFNTIDELKAVVGGAVNVSVELDSMAPAFAQAESTYLLPVLGQKTLTDWKNGSLNDIDEPAKRALAHLAVFEYSHIAEVQLSESGIVRFENENARTAFKYQTHAYRETLLRYGYESLEQLLVILLSKADSPTFQKWHDEVLATGAYDHVVNFASEFSKRVPVSPYVFAMLRPLIAETEVFVIAPVIGDEELRIFIDDYLLTLRDDTKSNRPAFKHLQSAVAHFVIAKALKEQWVKFDSMGRVTMVEVTGGDGVEERRSGIPQAIGIKADSHEVTAQRFVKLMLQEMDAHLDDYPKYKAKKEAAAATAAEPSACAKNQPKPVDRW